MRNQKIVAIGGGGIGQPGRKAETTAIDREVVRLTGKRRPHFVFLPTASMDDTVYGESFARHYGRLGCTVDVVRLWKGRPARAELARRIGRADGIYVGGGNTLKMMNLWKRLGVVGMLGSARRRGAALAGLSAGSICWFRWGNSDSRIKFPGDKTLIRVSALGYLDALNCPHYDGEAHRQESLKSMMRRTPGVAIAVEDNAALEVVGDRWRVIVSKPGKKAYRVYWKDRKHFKEPLLPGPWRPLRSLLAL